MFLYEAQFHSFDDVEHRFSNVECNELFFTIFAVRSCKLIIHQHRLFQVACIQNHTSKISTSKIVTSFTIRSHNILQSSSKRNWAELSTADRTLSVAIQRRCNQLSGKDCCDKAKNSSIICEYNEMLLGRILTKIFYTALDAVFHSDLRIFVFGEGYRTSYFKKYSCFKNRFYCNKRFNRLRQELTFRKSRCGFVWRFLSFIPLETWNI